MSLFDDLVKNKKVFIDEEGRSFFYLFVPKPHSKKVIVHFTAFFGDWGDRKEYKEVYQGYFHRLKMLGAEEQYNSLFLCDEYGVTKNGTYYLGEKGDLFVERAMIKIIEKIFSENNLSFSESVMIGSSMGATAALKFGMHFQSKAILTICPHIDLDICAKMQGRESHVSYVCPDGNAYNKENWGLTRKIRIELEKMDVGAYLPVLYVQSCADDIGVHHEQVVPFVDLWRSKKGTCYLDARQEGGHTSDYCHKSVILNVLDTLFAGRKVNVKSLQAFKYLPEEQKNIRYQFRKLIRRFRKSFQ